MVSIYSADNSFSFGINYVKGNFMCKLDWVTRCPDMNYTELDYVIN